MGNSKDLLQGRGGFLWFSYLTAVLGVNIEHGHDFEGGGGLVQLIFIQQVLFAMVRKVFLHLALFRGLTLCCFSKMLWTREKRTKSIDLWVKLGPSRVPEGKEVTGGVVEVALGVK